MIKFLMQDACQAESSAACIAHPNTLVFLCYFHLKTNVRDRLKGNKKKAIPQTPDKLHQMIIEDITHLH